MPRNPLLFAGVACLLGTLPILPATASAPKPDPRRFDTMQVVKLENGPNTIDIDGDGRDDMIFDGYRPSVNAHGFAHITFYVRNNMSGHPPGPSTPKATVWEIVPFVDEAGSTMSWFGADAVSTREAFETLEGADCMLRDMVVLKPANVRHAPITIITATRDFGQSYADPQHVMFSVYRFRRDEGSDAPYFTRVDHFRSKHLFCDVYHAIAAELGVKFVPPLDNDGPDH